MTTAKTRAERPGFPRFSRAAVLAVLVAATLSAPAAKALTPAEIAHRIEAAFGLAPQNPADLTARLMTKASMRRAVDSGNGTMLLSYGPSANEELAPSLAALENLIAAPAVAIEVARLPRPRPDDVVVTGSIAPAAPEPAAERTPVAETSMASEAEFFGRFAGSFQGSGQVLRTANAGPNEVNCALTGKPSGNRIVIAGRCGVAMFSREISADIRVDPATGRYTGTYVGAKVGPAKLVGRRSGDAVVLAITWPKPVNGDTKATMTIRNAGNNQLAIIVTDAFQPGGPTAEVTRLALARI